MDYMNLQNLLQGPIGVAGMPTPLDPVRAADVQRQQIGAYQQMLRNQQQQSDLSLLAEQQKQNEYQQGQQLRDLTRQRDVGRIQGEIQTLPQEIQDRLTGYKQKEANLSATQEATKGHTLKSMGDVATYLQTYATSPMTWTSAVDQLKKSGFNLGNGITGDYEQDKPFRTALTTAWQNSPEFKQKLEEQRLGHTYRMAEIGEQGKYRVDAVASKPQAPNRIKELADDYAALIAFRDHPQAPLSPKDRAEVNSKIAAYEAYFKSAEFQGRAAEEKAAGGLTGTFNAIDQRHAGGEGKSYSSQDIDNLTKQYLK